MRDAVGVTAAQQTNVIRMPRDVWQKVRDFKARLPTLLKRTQRREQFVLRDRTPRFESAEGFRNRLACKTNQIGLWIKQVNVTWPARHKEKDDAFGLRQSRRSFRSASIPKPPPARWRNCRRLVTGANGIPGPGHRFVKSIDIGKGVQVEQGAAK